MMLKRTFHVLSNRYRFFIRLLSHVIIDLTAKWIDLTGKWIVSLHFWTWDIHAFDFKECLFIFTFAPWFLSTQGNFTEHFNYVAFYAESFHRLHGWPSLGGQLWGSRIFLGSQVVQKGIFVYVESACKFLAQNGSTVLSTFCREKE